MRAWGFRSPGSRSRSRSTARSFYEIGGFQSAVPQHLSPDANGRGNSTTTTPKSSFRGRVLLKAAQSRWRLESRNDVEKSKRQSREESHNKNHSDPATADTHAKHTHVNQSVKSAKERREQDKIKIQKKKKTATQSQAACERLGQTDSKGRVNSRSFSSDNEHQEVASAKELIQVPGGVGEPLTQADCINPGKQQCANSVSPPRYDMDVVAGCEFSDSSDSLNLRDLKAGTSPKRSASEAFSHETESGEDRSCRSSKKHLSKRKDHADSKRKAKLPRSPARSDKSKRLITVQNQPLPSSKTLCSLIRGVYAKHKSSKLANLDATLDKYSGKLADVYFHICRKYGEQPATSMNIYSTLGRHSKVDNRTSKRRLQDKEPKSRRKNKHVAQQRPGHRRKTQHQQRKQRRASSLDSRKRNKEPTAAAAAAVAIPMASIPGVISFMPPHVPPHHLGLMPFPALPHNFRNFIPNDQPHKPPTTADGLSTIHATSQSTGKVSQALTGKRYAKKASAPAPPPAILAGSVTGTSQPQIVQSAEVSKHVVGTPCWPFEGEEYSGNSSSEGSEAEDVQQSAGCNMHPSYTKSSKLLCDEKPNKNSLDSPGTAMAHDGSRMHWRTWMQRKGYPISSSPRAPQRQILNARCATLAGASSGSSLPPQTSAKTHKIHASSKAQHINSTCKHSAKNISDETTVGSASMNGDVSDKDVLACIPKDATPYSQAQKGIQNYPKTASTQSVQQHLESPCNSQSSVRTADEQQAISCAEEANCHTDAREDDLLRGTTTYWSCPEQCPAAYPVGSTSKQRLMNDENKSARAAIDVNTPCTSPVSAHEEQCDAMTVQGCRGTSNFCSNPSPAKVAPPVKGPPLQPPSSGEVSRSSISQHSTETAVTTEQPLPDLGKHALVATDSSVLVPRSDHEPSRVPFARSKSQPEHALVYTSQENQSPASQTSAAGASIMVPSAKTGVGSDMLHCAPAPLQMEPAACPSQQAALWKAPLYTRTKAPPPHRLLAKAVAIAPELPSHAQDTALQMPCSTTQPICGIIPGCGTTAGMSIGSQIPHARPKSGAHQTLNPCDMYSCDSRSMLEPKGWRALLESSTVAQ